MGSSRSEHVARMERRRDRFEQNLGGGDRDDVRHPLGCAPGRSEQPIVGAHEDAAVPRPDCDIQVPADTRIDDGKDDGFVPKVGQGIRQQERAGTNVEGRHTVRQVDHLALRRDLVDDGVANPDPLVAVAEVRKERDRVSHAHRATGEASRLPGTDARLRRSQLCGGIV